ncbi:MAG: hypothetical protein AAF495_09280 [Pseudomonadota bacterium]
MVVMLEDARTGDRKPLSIGWNWTFFFFGPVLGIPLFWRGLTAWGAAIVFLWALDVALPLFLPRVPHLEFTVVVPAVLIAALTIYVAYFGNGIIGRRYLAQGYDFARPYSAEARAAAQRWGLLA